MSATPLTRLGKHFAPPRFVGFAIALGVALALLIPATGWARGTMAAFDIASALFLLSIVPLLWSKTDRMRDHARANDANRALLLGLTGLVSLVILVAVFSELQGKPSPTTIALVVGTLALSWLFSNTIYTLHYAHLYYSEEDGEDRGGIDFPGGDAGYEPDYWDFAYFSFTLGMTFQTSDVEISHAAIRRTVIGHCLAAFVFNIGVLAFSINVLGGGG